MLLASSPLRAEDATEDVKTPLEAKVEAKVEAVFRGREQPQQPQEANDRLRDSKQLWPILASYYTQVRFYKDQSLVLFSYSISLPIISSQILNSFLTLTLLLMYSRIKTCYTLKSLQVSSLNSIEYC